HPAAIAAMYATALERGGQRSEGLAPSSVKMMHRLLVQAFKQAVKWQLIARNPVDAVSAPRVERRQMRVLDTDGAAAYLAAARGHELFVPIMLGVLCGLRRGEIAALARPISMLAGWPSRAASSRPLPESAVRRPRLVARALLHCQQSRLRSCAGID